MSLFLWGEGAACILISIASATSAVDRPTFLGETFYRYYSVFAFVAGVLCVLGGFAA